MQRVTAHFRYLLVVASICVVLPCVVIALTASSFYYRHSSSFWDVVDEHQFSVHDQSADVVFIGDSSLLYGVSPLQINRETGLSAYSLGVPLPTLLVDHELLVRHYLAHNKAPRLMVLYLAATTRARPPYAMPPHWYEGEAMLMRYGEPRDVVDFFASKAEEITRFPTVAARRLLVLDWSGRQYKELAKELDAGAGHVPQPPRPTLGSGDCPISSAAVLPDEEFIRNFRRYATAKGIATAVYLAPIPDCDPTFAGTASRYSQFVDNVPYTLPHDLFSDDPQREHLISPGPQQNSKIIATFLQRFMATSGTGAHAP